jgi:hypothetical protein
VSILVGVQFLQGLALFGYGVFLTIVYGWPGIASLPEGASRLLSIYYELASGFGLLLFSLPIFLVAMALMRMKSWAWLAAMALQGLGLMVALLAYALGRPNYLAMLLGVLLVFYLNQQEVQAAFRGQRG